MTKTRMAVLLALAALAGACSEGTVAPASRAPEAPPALGGGSTAALTAFDTIRFSFVINPAVSATYYLGAGNAVVIPAGALCDPFVTKYGPSEWDRACVVAKAPLTVSVKAWMDKHGHPRVDFSPDIRFAPSASSAGWVKLTFTDWEAASDITKQILYCRTAQSGCIDESKSDPALVTYRDAANGKITRRLKHFSGYNVAAGDYCEQYPDDPDCIDQRGSMNVMGVTRPTVSPLPSVGNPPRPAHPQLP